jgi:hypothetical protein
MFCPVCWKQYPKGFIKCDACDVPLSEGEPKGHEHHHHDEKPSKGPSKPSAPQKPKK